MNLTREANHNNKLHLLVIRLDNISLISEQSFKLGLAEEVRSHPVQRQNLPFGHIRLWASADAAMINLRAVSFRATETYPIPFWGVSPIIDLKL